MAGFLSYSSSYIFTNLALSMITQQAAKHTEPFLFLQIETANEHENIFIRIWVIWYSVETRSR